MQTESNNDFFNFGKLCVINFDKQISRSFHDDDYISSGYHINVSKNTGFTYIWTRFPIELFDPSIFHAVNNTFESKRINGISQTRSIDIHWNDFVITFIKTHTKSRCVRTDIKCSKRYYSKFNTDFNLKYLQIFYWSHRSNPINSSSINQYTKWMNECKQMYGIEVPTFRFKCTYWE